MEEKAEESILQTENITKKEAFWQNFKIPVLVFSIFVGLAILLSSWLVSTRSGSSKEGSEVPSEGAQEQRTENGSTVSTEQFTVTTDKIGYDIDDKIEIESKNENDYTVCFGSCSSCPSCYAYELEEQQVDGSFGVVKEWGCGGKESVIGESLEPGQSTKFFTYHINQNPQEDAVYRIGIFLSSRCSGIGFEPEEKVYSNEFTIKSLDLPLAYDKVPFVEYPSGEIVSGLEEYTGNNFVEKDLNGDGEKENISVDKVRYPDDFGFAFRLSINGVEKRIANFNVSDFSVVDLDEDDIYQEVVLHDPGPSNDDVSSFFWYDGENIEEIGELARWPRILGNGEVRVSNWMGFWSITDTYILNEETHELELVPKETYGVGIETKARDTVRLYKEKSYDSEVVKEIGPGEEVKIILAEGCGESYFCEWFQLEAAGKKGWAKQADIIYNLELNFAD